MDLVLSTLDLERSFPDTPAFFAEIAEKVWVAPQNWPSAPSGWAPPTGWRPDPSWGPAPDGWEFIQPEPTEIAKNLERRDQVFLLGASGTKALLNRVEDYMAWSVATVARLRELSKLLESIGAGDRLLPSEESQLALAQDEVVRSASAARTYVLHGLFSLGEFDKWFRSVRAALNAAVYAFYESARSVIQRLGDEALWVVSADSPAPDATRVEVYEQFMRASGTLGVHSPFDDEEDEDEADPAGRGRALWERAEELAAAELRDRGFRDAQRTPPGTDGGFDVEGRGIVAQVKYLGTPVGREAIQRLVGANTPGARMAFFSRAGYTRTALAFAEVADVALFTLNVEDESVVGANDLGERLWA